MYRHRTYRSLDSYYYYPYMDSYLHYPYLDVPDRRRFTFEADNIVAQLPHDIRRETIVLNRPDSTPKVCLRFLLISFILKTFSVVNSVLQHYENMPI